MEALDTGRDNSPATLVAIARAAHVTGDRELERAARRELAERFHIRLTFERRDDEREEEVTR